jgi:anti-anti-sigma regulatory factor
MGHAQGLGQTQWSGDIMLRITQNLENGTAVRIKLDGTINADSYVELEKVLARHNGADGRTIILDMAGVDFMNDEAARNLIRLLGGRVRVINCSPFIEMLLDTVDRRDGRP